MLCFVSDSLYTKDWYHPPFNEQCSDYILGLMKKLQKCYMLLAISSLITLVSVPFFTAGKNKWVTVIPSHRTVNLNVTQPLKLSGNSMAYFQRFELCFLYCSIHEMYCCLLLFFAWMSECPVAHICVRLVLVQPYPWGSPGGVAQGGTAPLEPKAKP